jgi:hypothetical protein
MWNPSLNSYHVTRDVVWLHRFYFQGTSNGTLPQMPMIEDGEGESVEFPVPNTEFPTAPPIENLQGATAPTAPPAANPFPQMVADLNEEVLREQEQAVTSELARQQIPAGPPAIEGRDGFVTVTRSGRTVRRPERFKESAVTAVTQAEQNYYEALLEISTAFIDKSKGDDELAVVGAALGGGFEHTAELRPMKFKEAMATKDKAKWLVAVKEEFDRMQDHKVFKLVAEQDVPKGAKILTSTWAMKKKSSGKFRAHLN